MKKIIAMLSLLMALTACSSLSNTSNISKVGKTQKSISSTQWVLAENVKENAPVLTIQEGKISGNAGCNDYNAELFLNASNGSFSVKNISTTRMMCKNSSVEQNFLNMLSVADKYVVSDTVLELYKGNLLLMKLNKK